MQRLRQFVALAVLVLWLPATLHCAIEAAGLEIVFVCHDHETQSAADNHCEDDARHAIEDVAYSAAVLTKLIGHVLFSVVALLLEPVELPSAAIFPERSDVPRELRRRWHFMTRAALPARAPSLIG